MALRCSQRRYDSLVFFFLLFFQSQTEESVLSSSSSFYLFLLLLLLLSFSPALPRPKLRPRSPVQPCELKAPRWGRRGFIHGVSHPT